VRAVKWVLRAILLHPFLAVVVVAGWAIVLFWCLVGWLMSDADEREGF